MIDVTSPKGRLIAAALKLAETRPWGDISLLQIADAAAMPLDEVRRAFGAKSQILAGFMRLVDDEVLKRAPTKVADGARRDALFEVIMSRLDVLADAQQEKVYVQSFRREGDGWQVLGALAVRPFVDWLSDRATDAWVSGAGLHRWAARLPAGIPVVDATLWDPQPESLLQLGLRRYSLGDRDDPFALEPLYLRPSSAEEQHRARQGGTTR